MVKMEKKKTKVNKQLLSIVGIGASSGSLSALKKFFSHVTSHQQIAYVVVVHLSPEHKSMLAELLQPHVDMPVVQVTSSIALKPDQVYVIPPNANLEAIDTHLHITKLEEERKNRAPIDHFFTSLAQMHDGKSIAVLLTGNGADGSVGIKEIRKNGGMVIAQDPKEAEYDGMTKNAIFTGWVDKILPIDQMGEHILNFANNQAKILSLESDNLVPAEDKQVAFLSQLIRDHAGHDLQYYEKKFILQYVLRRMKMQQEENLEAYIQRLHSDQEELDALIADIMMREMRFFDDEKIFQLLEHEIIPKIFHKKNKNRPIRAWALGCSTGEEAYSLAMLFIEAKERLNASCDITIFASDSYNPSIQRSRQGFFTDDIKTQLSERRLARFFIKSDSGYQVKNELRDIVTFCSHKLMHDPPFSWLDLVISQKILSTITLKGLNKIMHILHFAILEQGYWIPVSIDNPDVEKLFTKVKSDLPIFQKRNGVKKSSNQEYLSNFQPVVPEVHNQVPGIKHRQIVEQMAPPSLLLSANAKILHLSEIAGKYLKITGGHLQHNIFQLILPELLTPLHQIWEKAHETNKTVGYRPVNVKIAGKESQIVLSLRKTDEASAGDFILWINEIDIVENLNPDSNKKSYSKKIESLETELTDNQKSYNQIVKKYELSQEELRSATEELESNSEEFRSILEELETSKEELQSVNEELQVLNQENISKVSELKMLSDDLQNLMSATNIATLFLNKKMQIIKFTPQLKQLYNIRETDINRPLADFTHKLDNKHILEDAMAILEDQKTIEREVKDKDGNYFLVRILPYFSEEATIAGVVVTFFNINERKKNEEALRKAKEKAEKAAKAKEEFLAHMSHEIRTPLNAIVGLSHLLLHQSPKQEQLDNLNTLKIASENLRHIINDILDLSKIQAGKVVVYNEEVELRLLVEGICKVHDVVASEKGVHLDITINEKVPHFIFTDYLKLSQVLNNLISNAIKFTPRGKVELGISVQRKKDDKVWLYFEISDTGIGIAEDKMKDIFEVFSQADSSTVRQFGGTGLGLSLCKQYLQLMGSNIKVESEIGKGSRFYFTLPGQIASGKKQAKKEVLNQAAKEIDFNTFRLLMVEDADVNRMVIRQFLENWWPLECVEASNGEEAIELAKKQKFDLILMDIRMPVMDGYEAAHQIRQLESHKETPIIALTADVSQKVKDEASKGLFSNIIVKPIDPDVLQTQLLATISDKVSLNSHHKEARQNNVKQGKYDYEKIFEMMRRDPESFKLFIEKSLNEIKLLRQNVLLAIDQSDYELIRKQEHKFRWTLQIYKMNSLHEQIISLQDLLINEANQALLSKARKKTDSLFQTVIEELQTKV